MIIQAEEILDAIADGVAVVDPDLRVIWANPEFLSVTRLRSAVTGAQVLPGPRRARKFSARTRVRFTTAVSFAEPPAR